MAEVFIARESAIVEYDGAPVRIRKGITRIEDGHPLLEAHANLFTPADEGAQFPVRTAKAEPKVAAEKPKKPVPKAD